jgi:hypothetical protein
MHPRVLVIKIALLQYVCAIARGLETELCVARLQGQQRCRLLRSFS